MANKLYTVNQLKSSLKYGGALPSKFKVDIQIPLLLKSLPFFKTVNLSDDYMSIMAKTASIPGKRISTTKVYYRGQPFVIRGAAEFDNTWKVSFYNTPKMDIHTLFSDWMYRIDSFDSSITQSIFLGNYIGIKGKGVGYMTDLYVSQLSNDGSIETKYKICYAFPTNIDEIQLDGSNSRDLTLTEVTFAYTYWEKV